MRTTQYMLFTLKETPSDADVISHQLMLRSGMIRKLASGLYTWLPTGMRVLKKVEKIIREVMNDVGAIEISMPIVQPVNLWEESGRWQQYGPELLNMQDRHKRSFVLAPTHEEVITHLVRNELSSYRQLPITFYQIQTKFRDEVRPRFGVVRSREFLMKDAYSFHISQESLQKTYYDMYCAYSKIFNCISLDFCVIQADTGAIGGSISHEFQVLVNNKSGENNIFLSNQSNYAANAEKVEALSPIDENQQDMNELVQFDTPNVETINELVKQYQIPIEKTVKTLVVKATEESGHTLVALLLRGDHQLNKIKAEQLDIVSRPLEMATKEQIFEILKVNPGSLGPVRLSIPIIADRSVAKITNFCAGANIDGKHLKGINWGRDLPKPRIEDIRNVITGEPSPDGKGILQIKHGIEVGHIFQLGTKYSDVMKAYVKNKHGQNQIITMGCYGIGITRVVAAVIEQNHDDHGIIWPISLAPFELAILPINMHKSFQVQSLAEELYQEFCNKGIEVIIDDRKEYPGVMFSDIELIGIPHIIVISENNINKGEIEYKNRSTRKKQIINKKEIVNFLINLIKDC